MSKKTTGLVNQEWVQELLTRESFTSKEAGELAGGYGPDATNRLRNDKGLRLVPLGPVEGGHPHAKRYRLERVEEEA